MDTEHARAFLLTLPHVVETMQFGDNLVFWAGDKAIGGKMFCLIDLNDHTHGVASFAAGPERYHELLELDGMFPAPYLARIFWAAARHWGTMRQSEWEDAFRNAHHLTIAKLTRRTLDVLSMPQKERDKLIAERRKLLATKASEKTESKSKASSAKLAKKKARAS